MSTFSDPFDPSGSGWHPAPAEAPGGAAAGRGVVRGFRDRTETGLAPFAPNQMRTVHVWEFELERYQGGQPLEPISVEMRGERFTGLIRDGLVVALYEAWQPGLVHATSRVRNVSNNIDVVAVMESSRPRILASVVALAFGLAAMGGAAYMAWSHGLL
jgi:hypothetical protein